HLHPFYKEIFHTFEGLCPVAEQAYEQILSLPIYPGLSNKDMEHVFKVMREKISK
ncbi:DegT/DnrJ/EryC1/StrS family aminotransferase, partial [bacterium]|nr:DegT/DnrJ/EryC1/StrS family aminotransferase [bacterium]